MPLLSASATTCPSSDLDQLAVADFVDANLLFALEAADLTDPLAAILLDDLVLDAREDLARR